MLRHSLINQTRSSTRPLTPIIRSFHSTPLSASQRAREQKSLRDRIGDVQWDTTTISVKLLMESLRLLKCRQVLKEKSDRAAPYRDAIRDLSQIIVGKEQVTLNEIEQVLTEENGVSWRAIGELLSDGYIPELEKMSDETRAAANFCRVHGIGSVKAWQFAEAGYRTLDDLEGVDTLTKAQRLGLLHLEDMETLIPRAEIETFQGLLTSAFKKARATISFEIMGSYRRGEKYSSDIDLVAWHESYSDLDDETQAETLKTKIFEALEEDKLLTEDKFFANGKKKIMALTKLPGKQDATWRQIDIRVCPVPSLPYMLLGNTGDDFLMKILRAQAKQRKWTLNEYCMGTPPPDKFSSSWSLPGHRIIVKDEKEIFEKLGVPYLKPEQRSFKVYERILPRRYLP